MRGIWSCQCLILQVIILRKKSIFISFFANKVKPAIKVTSFQQKKKIQNKTKKNNNTSIKVTLCICSYIWLKSKKPFKYLSLFTVNWQGAYHHVLLRLLFFNILSLFSFLHGAYHPDFFFQYPSWYFCPFRQ